MAVGGDYLAYVMDLLSVHGEVNSKRFFGGVGLVACGRQFAMVMKDTLYFCVSARTRPHFEEHDIEPFSYFTKRGRVQVRRYYEVPVASAGRLRATEALDGQGDRRCIALMVRPAAQQMGGAYQAMVGTRRPGPTASDRMQTNER